MELQATKQSLEKEVVQLKANVNWSSAEPVPLKNANTTSRIALNSELLREAPCISEPIRYMALSLVGCKLERLKPCFESNRLNQPNGVEKIS